MFFWTDNSELKKYMCLDLKVVVPYLILINTKTYLPSLIFYLLLGRSHSNIVYMYNNVFSFDSIS